MTELILTIIGIILIIASIFIGAATFKKMATPSKEKRAGLKIGEFFHKVMKIVWIFVKILIVVLVVLALLKMIQLPNKINFKKQPEKTVVETVVKTPHQHQKHLQPQHRGTIFLNGGSVGVVVKQNNSKIMEFTTQKGAHFKWNKRDKYGKWSPSYPKDSGLWRLRPTKNPKIFKGEVSDNKSGIFIQMTLKMN